MEREESTPGERSTRPGERWTQATVYPDMWVDPDDDPRERGGADGEDGVEGVVDERALLLDSLRSYRLTVEMKCAGLDAEQLARRSVPPSTMSLLGLVRHLTEDERHVRRIMTGEDAPWLYRTEADRDADWDGAVADPAVVADAFDRWRAEMAATDRMVASIDDLGATNAGHSDLGATPGGEIQLRELLLSHVEEYARHCGHADLLRECIDGRVGQ
ncbi:DinB family protein [Isoptericola cucumis]|uniref:DinB family protein n=1 Tax=Isoptericola cucumis TaxID=1776856 RepID=A0ABQ2BD58_9MICO|nr:DinB family protein [Isoptericola cucumis]GGI11375.1 hypothetical protein GCM10007368_35890 [Isoptericola cucumis]